MVLVIVDKDKENLKCSSSFAIFANLVRKLVIPGSKFQVPGS